MSSRFIVPAACVFAGLCVSSHMSMRLQFWRNNAAVYLNTVNSVQCLHRFPQYNSPTRSWNSFVRTELLYTYYFDRMTASQKSLVERAHKNLLVHVGGHNVKEYLNFIEVCHVSINVAIYDDNDWRVNLGKRSRFAWSRDLFLSERHLWKVIAYH